MASAAQKASAEDKGIVKDGVGMTNEEFYGDKFSSMKSVESRLLSLLDLYAQTVEEKEGLKPIIYTCSRIKSPDNMVAKLKRKGLETTPEAALNKLYDAIGIRAVCAFAEDVYRLVDWLKKRCELKVCEEKDYYAVPKPNGYRSYHLLVKMRGGKNKGFKAEIQVRTIANDFWATLEHRLKYKKIIPHEEIVYEELKRCAFEIASVDASMQAIRDILKEKI